MNGLYEAAIEIQAFLIERQWRFCFIGGLAVIRWGEPRATQDVELCLLTGFGEERPYVQALAAAFPPRLSDAVTFAIESRVLLVSTHGGVPVDVSLGGLPFEERMVERASDRVFEPECTLRTCSAEDLIVLKAFAHRTRDWADVEGIVARQGAALDTDYIFEQLTPLADADESPEIVPRLRALLREAT